MDNELNRHLIEEEKQKINKQMKICTSYVFKECKEKQRDITTHSLEWPKPKTLTIPNADGVEGPEPSFTDSNNRK